MGTNKIKHMVIFNLKHSKGSIEAEQFLIDGQRLLSSIPVVNNFEVYRQVSVKNDYDYGFSMEFTSQAEYDTYNEHQIHSDFVENRWMVEVTRFLEIDLQ